MNPIDQSMFSYDYQRFVLQKQEFQTNPLAAAGQPKPFNIEAGTTEKAKKDQKKEKEGKNQQGKKRDDRFRPMPYKKGSES